METVKYRVKDERKLKSWEQIARKEIHKWLTDEAYENEINKSTMKNESMGPFTKFLYHFASICECGWGVMVDFDERKQRIFLPDHYYKWMHKLRDEILLELDKADESKNDTQSTQSTWKILDKDGIQMPDDFSVTPRTYEKVKALVDRLNVNGENKPYTMIQN